MPKMMGACLLATRADSFGCFVTFWTNQSEFRFSLFDEQITREDDVLTIRFIDLRSENGAYVMINDREPEGCVDEDLIPVSTKDNGYKYIYYVECSSSSAMMFLDVVKKMAASFELLLWDSKGEIVSPKDLNITNIFKSII